MPERRSGSKKVGRPTANPTGRDGGGGGGGALPTGGSTHSDLRQLERRLQSDVDEDFFQDPKKFRTLHRVIDVLGAQLLDEEGGSPHQQQQQTRDTFEQLHRNNPAYLALRRQQRVVEDAIEHMAVHHCGDLNASVVAVGKVARQFNEAVTRVRQLRRQVREVKEHLGSDNPNEAAGAAGSVADPSAPGGGEAAVAAQQAAAAAQSGGKSLRELWLKKLECEAVLGLLRKLEIIRRAPITFDHLVAPRDGGPCRVGAAVVLLSDALQTMFSDDVAQVQALHKIMEQLMTRKQRAEELIWEALNDVLFLRTGNSVKAGELGEEMAVGAGAVGAPSVAADAKAKGVPVRNTDPTRRHHYISAVPPSMRHVGGTSAVDLAAPDDGASDDGDSDSGSESDFSDDGLGDDVSVSSASIRSGRPVGNSVTGGGGDTYQSLLARGRAGRTIPRAVVESDLDLEADEMRCLEDAAFGAAVAGGSAHASGFMGEPSSPRYADPVLALRILVEALAKLGRLDDVERHLAESLETEIRKIIQAEQVRTVARLDRRRGRERSKRAAALQAQQGGMAQFEAEEAMRDFRLHLGSLLVAFGSILMRLNYLAQILRHRISSDPNIACPSYSDPKSALFPILVQAQTTMQREIKIFLGACLKESDAFNLARGLLDSIGEPDMGNSSNQQRNNAGNDAGRNVPSHERGLFSLGIVGDVSGKGKDSQSLASLAASRASVAELMSDQFVHNILFPRTNTHPQVRHALTFRRAVASFTQEAADLKKELAVVTGEDTSSPTYNATTEETSLDFLDTVIQRTLLPMLQDEAVNGTISALERDDAFEPIIDGALYARSAGGGGGVSDVQMCVACQALYKYTEPLFAALHRLPIRGDMYSPLVAVLEHAILTFNSRVKQRVSYICRGKKAHVLLQGGSGLESDIEMRKSYALLIQAYFGEDDIDAGAGVSVGRVGGIVPLTPSSGDTKSKKGGGKDNKASGKKDAATLAVGATDLEREEEAFEREIAHLYPLLDFVSRDYGADFVVCADNELARAATLAHSLLRVSSLLEERIKTRRGASWERTAGATRALREAIKTIRAHGVFMAKFVRVDMLVQTVKRMSKICKSSTLVAKDAVRLPSCVNDLGEYLTAVSDVLREAGGNKIAAYGFSSLEQYVPLFLMQTVRIVAKGKGITGSVISLNGVEALDRSGSVLYRDLKGATGFEGSFWDDEVAADAFERSASYVAIIELDMDELVAYCRNNKSEFSDEDYKLMFTMDGPRRTGDIAKYNVLKGVASSGGRRDARQSRDGSK